MRVAEWHRLAVWVMLVCGGLPIGRAVAGDPAQAAPFHRLYLMFDKDQNLAVRESDNGQSGEFSSGGVSIYSMDFHFVGLHPPKGAERLTQKQKRHYVTVTMDGHYERSGPGKRTVTFTLKLDAKVPLEIVFYGLTSAADAETQHSFTFEPGQRELTFTGYMR